MNFFQRLFGAKKHVNAQHLLVALAHGSTLKSHRDLEGKKKYVLHHLDNTQDLIDDAIVERLKQQRMIDSNKKFPAETYLLTQRGRHAATKLTQSDPLPLSSRNF